MQEEPVNSAIQKYASHTVDCAVEALIKRKHLNNANYALPTVINRRGSALVLDSYAAHACPPDQLRQAELLFDYDLRGKANRQLACGIYGGIRECGGGHRFYIPYRCGNRYCKRCGPVGFAQLFHRHLRLRSVVRRLVPHWPVRGRRPTAVIAKVDFTCRTFGQMPTPDEVRTFNADIRRFFRALEARYGISRKQYGALWCDEFGGPKNCNLHAHGIYAGPWLPQKKKELSRLRAEIRGDGSFIVSIKIAKAFEGALAHALKYAGKFLSHDPARLAQLEKTFHRVRRVHALAEFYRPKDAEPDKPSCSPACPLCGEGIGVPVGWRWRPISELRSQGVRELDAVRREVGSARVFADSRGAPS